VLYNKQPWDEIPSLPVHRDEKEQRQSTAFGQDHGRGLSDEKFQQEQAVPYVEAARDFFLPQWVAFDSEGKLLVRSVNEAEAHLQSMSRFLSILHTAAELAPYIVADEEYQRKRYGISGQLLNQGRALADYAVDEMIRKIKTRAADHDLDRGLSLSVPYFDDQTMTLEVCPFDVIPVGRVMFVPAFIVLAVRSQGAKVAQDIRFNKSTRRHLLMELSKLEEAFLR
jgi:hypothetical protein